MNEDSAFYVEIIEDNYHYAPMLGFAISNEAWKLHIPFDVANTIGSLKEWVEDESMRKYVYDAKRTIVALNELGIEIKELILICF